MLATVLRDTANANSNASITLTGHSLGGAVAQLVGKVAGIQAVTFNAPGPLEFASALAASIENILGQVSIPSPSSVIVDYRLGGDQISLAGTQVGTSVIVSDPPALGLSVGAVATNISAYHSMATLFDQLDSEPVEYAGSSLGPIEFAGAAGPDVLGTLNFGANLAVGPTNLESFDASLTALVEAFFDSKPAFAYSLTVGPGSPEIESLQLPVGIDSAGANVAGWELTYNTSTGQSRTEMSSTGKFAFASAGIINPVRLGFIQ